MEHSLCLLWCCCAFTHTVKTHKVKLWKVIRQQGEKDPAAAADRDCISSILLLLHSPISDIPTAPLLSLTSFFFCLAFLTPLLHRYHVPAFPPFLSCSSPLPLDVRGGSRRRVYSAQGLSCYRVLNAMETKFLLHNSMSVCVCVCV